MVQITIAQGQGYITGVPPELEEKLIKLCAFKPVGAEYTRAFETAKKRKDVLPGYVKLLQNSKFPPGLQTTICEWLTNHKVPFEVNNHDLAHSKPGLEIQLSGIQSRPYQDDAIEACALVRRGVIQAPTGSGKTAIGARIIAAKGGHALVVVPTIDLLYQYKSFLEEHMSYEGVLPRTYGQGQSYVTEGRIGQLGDGVVDPQPVTIATVRTAAKLVGHAYESYEFGEYDDKDDTKLRRTELRDWVEAIATIIVDEAHILGAETVYDLCTKIPAINFFGMSASPWRDDGADLMIEGATGKKIYHIGTDELVKDGWLVPPVIQSVNTAGYWQAAAWGKICKRCGRQAVTWAQECTGCQGTDFKSQFADCYRKEIVENNIRNALVASEVYRLDVPTLVLVKQVKHGRILQSMIKDSVFLSGHDKSGVRSQAFQDMRDGKLRVLVATTIADMGLDLPILSALVLAGGGKSSTRHLQRIGRIARPYEGKEAALVVDFDDGHVHRWFSSHFNARRKIEEAEWGEVAIWI